MCLFKLPRLYLVKNIFNFKGRKMIYIFVFLVLYGGTPDSILFL